MKITFSKRTIKRLGKTVSEALKLNNLRLFKLAKSLLMVAEGYDIEHIAEFFGDGALRVMRFSFFYKYGFLFNIYFCFIYEFMN